jgi:hypothetical protein
MDIGTSIWLSPTARTVAINLTGILVASPLFTPDPGKRFAVHYLALSVTATTGTISFQSGGTNITGALNYDGTPSTGGQVSFALHASGMPIMLGINNGDVWQVSLSATTSIDGWAIVSQVDGTR